MTRKLFAATLSLFLAAAASAATQTETIDRTFDVKPGSSVQLSNVNGRITIKAWDQPRVKVVAVKEIEADKDDIQQAMKDLRIEFSQRAGGLVIATHYPKEAHGVGSLFSWILGDDIEAEVTFDLMVPRTMNVEVENTNGSIRMSDVTGIHELDTTNGKIEVVRCAGALAAGTTNGSIHAELASVTAGQPLRFETTNGRIEVELPKTLAVDVDASTVNGSIDTDLPVAATSLGRNSLRGKINGGGTSLTLRTTNGGIAIRTGKS